MDTDFLVIQRLRQHTCLFSAHAQTEIYCSHTTHSNNPHIVGISISFSPCVFGLVYLALCISPCVFRLVYLVYLLFLF